MLIVSQPRLHKEESQLCMSVIWTISLSECRHCSKRLVLRSTSFLSWKLILFVRSMEILMPSENSVHWLKAESIQIHQKYPCNLSDTRGGGDRKRVGVAENNNKRKNMRTARQSSCTSINTFNTTPLSPPLLNLYPPCTSLALLTTIILKRK